MVSRVKNKPTIAPTRKKRRLLPVLSAEVRFAAILGHIRTHGSTNTRPMAEALGWHYETARRFANMLVGLNQLHRTLEAKGHGHAEQQFHLGPAPEEGVEADDDVDRYPPIHAQSKAYPPCHRRDLWACAMFPVPAVLLEQRP